MALSASAQPSVKSFSSRVNPFIGTRVDKPNSLSGSTFPGATLPFGFVQLSPDTSEAPGNPASGYNYSDQEIYGFSHTHLSGTGCADLFDVLVMPWVGESAKPKSNYRSRFSHEKELARPGYYRVSLLDWEIEAELTATEHAGFHRYTFPQGGHSHVFVDLAHTANPGNAGHHVAAQIRVVDNRTLEGYRFTTGWVEGFRKVYFRAEFSKPFVTHTLISGEEPFQNLSILNGKDLKAVLDFETIKAEPILIKVGLSSVSAEGARLNLSTDIPGWSFDEVARQAGELWDKELGKIEVEGTPEQLEIFYTALYHAFIQPNNIADVNGDYVGTDMTVRRAPDRKHYSTFSLWDTYRAANPLYTLTQPEREVGFINSMLRQYDTYGFLPIW